MADQRHLPAAAERRAVEAAHHRHAQRLQAAEVPLDALDFGEHAVAVGGGRAHHALEVGAGEEGAFGRGQHDAFDLLAVLEHLGGHGVQVVLPLQAHGVDGGILLVEGEGGDAVGALVADGFRDHVSVSTGAFPGTPRNRLCRAAGVAPL
ncbi:hypothetical protein D9M68_750520 [compost metagenome]